MTQNKLLNEYLDITKKPLDDKGFLYDMDIAYKCVVIADDYAIEFADWIRGCKLKERSYDFDNIEELLKTYKKEKGL
jgi:hypothetical protein